jgi:drug/metabolite transporter (DMT)-like permease
LTTIVAVSFVSSLGVRRDVAASLGAAALFGLSAPFAKLLLSDAEPLALAPLLYLGAGIGLTLGAFRARPSVGREAPLRGTDAWLLAAMILAGGVAAPVLLLVGLTHVSAVVGSLLLNLEAPLTIVVAIGLLGEHLDGRAAAGAALVAVGAGIFAYAPSDMQADWKGVVAIALACLCWAIDNNLTQRLSLRDPIAIARAKGLGAGTASLALALLAGASFPRPVVVAAALGLGFVSYGVSVALAAWAMRSLGAARHSALFATAPFMGSLAAVPILGERFGSWEAGAGAVMAIGVILLLTEAHEHWHAHPATRHEHAHVHDEHHQHEHPEGWDGGEPHAHVHEHAPLSHAHRHVSDAHHRHRH